MCQIALGFKEISVLQHFFVGNNLKKGKELMKFVYGAVKTVESGDFVLRERCLLQVQSTVQ